MLGYNLFLDLSIWEKAFLEGKCCDLEGECCDGCRECSREIEEQELLKEGWRRVSYFVAETNLKTGTPFDEDGYLYDGFNRQGYNREGWKTTGIHRDTGTEYDTAGYDWGGWDKHGYNRDTGAKYDTTGWGYDEDPDLDEFGYTREFGYDEFGYDEFGRDPFGYDKFGYDSDGYDSEGFGRDGWCPDGSWHRDTGTEYDPDGYNHSGWNSENYNRDGEYNWEDAAGPDCWFGDPQGFVRGPEDV